MRNKLCICLFFLTSVLYGQSDNEVSDYIRDKKYGESPILDLYIIDNGLNVPKNILDPVFVTMEYGAKNAYYYGKINNRGIQKNLEISYNLHKCHYLGFYEILDFKLDKKGDAHNFKWVAVFKIIDVFTGEIVMVKNFNHQKSIKGYNEYIELSDSKDLSGFFENNRLGITDMILTKYPMVAMLLEVTQQKKDKAEIVTMDKRGYNMCGKPEEMYVFAINEKFEKNKKPVMTFKYVGRIEALKAKEAGEKKIQLKVKNGQAEILEYFNNNVTLYVSAIKFGEQ